MRPHMALVGLLGIAALLPAVPWEPPHVPAVPTHVPGSRHVARCQHFAASWDPSRSDASLTAWARCMRLRR